MSWISILKEPGHIIEAVSHFNRAIDLLHGRASMVEVSRHLFDALNKIQTEWSSHQSIEGLGEVKTFQTMIITTLEDEARNKFLESEELKNFVLLKPQIMNHDTLRRHRYRPDIDLEPNLVKKATDEHHSLETAYNAFLSKRDEETEIRVIKRSAELLYILRSNIAHGEKTPYGPDLKKRKRDEEVCNIVVPLQHLLINLLLDSPDQKLVIYGTLAPGKANYHIISNLSGTWEKYCINGSLDEVNGLPIFYWDISQPLIEVQLFISPDLPRTWGQIDHFEGSFYKRRLVTTKTDTGMSIAYIYLSNLK